MIVVEMLPAQEGDCFLIAVDNKYHILVDGGTPYTYRHYLKSRLIKLAEDKKVIDQLIVTHVDNDHIGGIIPFIKENGNASNPQIIPVKEVWHNSYRHLQFDKNGKLEFREKEILKSIVAKGAMEEHIKNNDESVKDISGYQGTTLAGLLYSNGYNWNTISNNLPIKKGVFQEIDKNIHIKVIAPQDNELEELGKVWKKQLMQKKHSFLFSDELLFDDAYEYYMRFLREPFIEAREISYMKEEENIEKLAYKEYPSDISVVNNSSICFEIDYKGTLLLFLGDKSVGSLDMNLIKEKYALLKVPHHGSNNNYSIEFAKKVHADVYLLSTNGRKYQHPDKEMVAKIIYFNKEKKKIFFNYNDLSIFDFLNGIELSRYNVEIQRPDRYETLVINIEGGE